MNNSKTNTNSRISQKHTSHLGYFETFIDKNILGLFYSTDGDWNGDIKYKALYQTWSNMKHDVGPSSSL